MEDNLFIKAHNTSNALEEKYPELANLIRNLDKNRMELVRCLEHITEDPLCYDFPKYDLDWVDKASDLVFTSRWIKTDSNKLNNEVQKIMESK